MQGLTGISEGSTTQCFTKYDYDCGRLLTVPLEVCDVKVAITLDQVVSDGVVPGHDIPPWHHEGLLQVDTLHEEGTFISLEIIVYTNNLTKQ